MKILSLLFLVSSIAFASDLHPKFDASYVHPRDSENGFETGLGVFLYPLTGTAWETGLRGAYSGMSRAGQSRHSWILGLQENFWIVNLAGPGLQVSWVSTSHYRVEPLVDIRLMHLGSDGAVAFRVGAPYEQQLGWGVAAGVTFQLSGLRPPEPSDSSDQ